MEWGELRRSAEEYDEMGRSAEDWGEVGRNRETCSGARWRGRGVPRIGRSAEDEGPQKEVSEGELSQDAPRRPPEAPLVWALRKTSETRSASGSLKTSPIVVVVVVVVVVAVAAADNSHTKNDSSRESTQFHTVGTRGRLARLH